MQVIHNVFLEHEVNNIILISENSIWEFIGFSKSKDEINFWRKELIHTQIKNIFQEKIEKNINKKIRVNELYGNGQSFGQCGFWHQDKLNPENDLSFLFFPKKWKPEFGGHFLINIDGKICSEIPEYNKGILFDSSLYHMGLSPSRHCNSQRESIICKFKIL